jgi:hypothetical protein
LHYSIYYKFSNYKKECLDEGVPIGSWNSNQKALLKLGRGDIVFIFTTKNDNGRSNIYLLATLLVKESRKSRHGPYGKYFLEPIMSKSKFYDFNTSVPLTALFKKLDFKKGRKPSEYGQCLQSIQNISAEDSKKIVDFSKKLKPFVKHSLNAERPSKKNDKITKALSIKQPYANWIADKKKTLEVRSWRTHYRGPLVICSSQSPANSESKDLPLGKTICKVELVDVRPMKRKDVKAAMCPYNPESYVWELKVIKRVRSRPVKGKLGIFNL